MAENSHGSTISGARTWQEMAEFWDMHSLAEYHDQTYAVEMTFDPAARRTAIVIEPDLLDDLTEIAHARSLSVQTLVNVWLRQAVDRAVAT